MKTVPADIAKRAAQLQNELKEHQKKIDAITQKLSNMMAVDLFNYSKSTAGLKVVAAKVENMTSDELRKLTDAIREKDSTVVCVLASVNGGKISFAAACGADAVKKGAHSGNILKEIAKLCGGGGGGRPDSATAGGSKPENLEAALEQVNNIVERQAVK